MSFLTPFMLFGALAAGIPVAIHLFFRSRYRTVPWAAMKFLLTSVEQTSRRLKFQELLLLLLRMLVLAMLAFAFARPISSVVRGAGRGDAVDAVFVFDTSFSMGASDGAKTRLQRGQEEALKIIKELPPHSTVQIITCAGNSKANIGPRSPANLDQAKLLVEAIELDDLATDLAVGVAEAQSVLKAGQASNKELYVFSDMQKMGFEQQPGALKTVLTAIKEKALVHFVRCGTREVKNVAIVGIAPQSGVPRPKEEIGFAVRVKNTGTETLNNLEVSLMIDGNDKSLKTAGVPSLPPGKERAVTVYGKIDNAGLRVLTARVKSDDLDGDNRFDQVILVREQVNILVVDGTSYAEKEPAKQSSFYLMHALAPVKDTDRAAFHIQPRMVSAALAAPGHLAKQDICILVNVALQAKAGVNVPVLPSEFVKALESFVRQGGHSLMVFGGDNVDQTAYNKILGMKAGLLPFPLKERIKAGDEPFLIDRSSISLPSFRVFRDDDEYYRDFGKVGVWQAHGLDETVVEKKVTEKTDKKEKESTDKAANDNDDPATVVLRFGKGKPLVAARKIDKGEVIFFATAANFDLNPMSNWTDWPLAIKVYIPFIQVTIAHLVGSQTQEYNLKAGDVLNYFPTDKLDHAYFLVHPDLKTVSRLGTPEIPGQGKDAEENKHEKSRLKVVTARDLPRAGIYYMKALPRGSESIEGIDVNDAVRTGTPIAVIPDLSESADLSTYSAGEINERLGFEPIHIIAGDSEGVSTGAERLNREWTVWALLAVLGLVLFEVVLAWWCGRAW